MIRFNQPPPREMPPEVRDRLRRKLWSELDVPARSRLARARAPIAAAVGAVVILVAGSVVLAKNGPSPSIPMAAAFGNANAASQGNFDRCYATATATATVPDSPQWINVWTSESDGITITTARVDGKPLFCETTATTVTVSDPNGVPGYAGTSGTAAMFATSNGVVAGVVDSDWTTFELRVSAEPGKSETVTPQLNDGFFVARTQTAIDPETPRLQMDAQHDTVSYAFGQVPPALVHEYQPRN